MTASPGLIACCDRSVSTRRRISLRISRAIATPSMILAAMAAYIKRRAAARFAQTRRRAALRPRCGQKWDYRLGGAEGDRTPDLDIANVALSQLSYCPARVARNMGRGCADCQGGPATSALLAPARADG